MPEERGESSEGIFSLCVPSTKPDFQPESFGVDIIAIHGLNGSSVNTWKNDNGTLWLRDLLPNDIPGARIHSFGYPSKLFLNNCVGGVRQFAGSLLRAIDTDPIINVSAFRPKLDDLPMKLQEGKRPIIYVCHSLGGIVLKKVSDSSVT